MPYFNYRKGTLGAEDMLPEAEEETGMKKLVVIGGGIAGLSAGIYALQRGFLVEIYEKNASCGGECTGWERQGYHIDNCIHWLTGCRPEDELYQIWRDIGAIDDETVMIREPYFYCMEKDGRKLHFWRDLEKARREFLALAPEDAKELNLFFDSVKRAECVKVPCDKSLAQMGWMEYMRFGMSMAKMGQVIKEYGKETIADLAGRFQNPYIREMLSRYMDPSYKAVALLSSYGFYTSGSAAIPLGGSVGMVRRIVKRFEQMGGTVYTNKAAKRVNVSGKRAESVSLEDGSVVPCDYIICAADASVTFGTLLDRKYMDRKLRKMYEKKEGYRALSTFHISFGIIGEEDYGLYRGSFVFPCESFMVGRQDIDYMAIRLYDYDIGLFPADRRVIQCSLRQTTEDYEYWKGIYDDKKAYHAEKMRIARSVETRIARRFPALKDRLILLDAYSPMTFTRWCGAYQGAYMSFSEQKGYKSLTAKNSIRGLSNVFVASQWLSNNGGLPAAAASGKFAVLDLG